MYCSMWSALACFICPVGAKLAREVAGAEGLTAGLADTLIDQAYSYPENRMEIFWKVKHLYCFLLSYCQS